MDSDLVLRNPLVHNLQPTEVEVMVSGSECLSLKRGVTFCNPGYISTGGALYWTLWVLPLTMVCEHSHTELHKRSRPIGAYLNVRAGPQYIRWLRLLPVILHPLQRAA